MDNKITADDMGFIINWKNNNEKYSSIKETWAVALTVPKKENRDVAPEHNINSLFAGIVKSLLKLISKSYQKKLNNLNSQVDSKLKYKIEQKKIAHGLKTEKTVNENNDNQGFTMSM